LKENSEQTQEPLREGEREDFSSDEAHGTETTLGSPRAGLAADEKAASDETIKREMRGKSRRSFLVGGLSILAGFEGWRWLVTRREDEGIIWPLRRGLEINEQVTRDYFKGSRLAATFPRELAHEPRVNGDEGMDEDFDPVDWKLRVMGLAEPAEAFASAASQTGSNDADESDGNDDDSSASASEDSDVLSLTLDDIKALARAEIVTELKCIEGWSTVVHWAGARFADFAARYRPATRNGRAPDVRNKPQDLVGYVSIETPGGGYYVGLDMESALQPQTLLRYEMNGEPLTLEHGAPLRLVIPVKYGIKNIKRIGMIRFTDKRPADFWAERGYDWYAGHRFQAREYERQEISPD